MNDDTSKDMKVLRLAIKFDPATIAVEYKRDGKLYHKKLSIKRLESVPKEILIDNLIKRNKILGPEYIERKQLEKLIDKLYKRISGGDITDDNIIPPTATATATTNAAAAVTDDDPATDDNPDKNVFTVLEKYNEVNLNKESDEVVAKAKQEMNVVFEKNALQPGQDGYIWDVRKDFEATEDNDWDEEESDD